MALGAVTIRKQGGGLGDLWYVVADVALTSGANYTTGGEVFAAAQVNRTGNLLAVIEVGGGSGGDGYKVIWDSVNKKLMVFQGDNANAAAAPGVQVAGNTNLSAVTKRFLCVGK